MRFFITILLATCFKISYSQTPPDSSHTVFWAIINAKGDTSFLLGTSHETGNSFFSKYPQTRRFRGADCIVTESVPDREEKSVALCDDWSKSLTRKERRRINKCIKVNFGYRLKHVKRAPPAWIHYMIFAKMFEKECKTWNEKDVVGMDEFLVNTSYSWKIKLYGLEPAGDPFNAINTMVGAKDNNDLAALASLVDIVVNKQKYIDTIKTMCWEHEDYKNLNINYRFNVASVSENPDFATLLDKRNDSWMPELKRIIDNNKAYVAVGLKHLYYKKGVIMQLIGAGYRVVPIPM